MEIPQKTKTRPTIPSGNTILGIYPKEYKSGYKRDTCMPMFIAPLFTITELWK
jgi:hypothetical protein